MKTRRHSQSRNRANVVLKIWHALFSTGTPMEPVQSMPTEKAARGRRYKYRYIAPC